MIRGIGIDLCDIERMRKMLDRGTFAKRVFSAEEIEYAGKGSLAAAHFAAAFAARVRRTESGPVFVFSEAFNRRLEDRGVKNVFLSITHEAGVAAAVVVLEGD